jgi:hypothetical protein
VVDPSRAVAPDPPRIADPSEDSRTPRAPGPSARSSAPTQIAELPVVDGEGKVSIAGPLEALAAAITLVADRPLIALCSTPRASVQLSLAGRTFELDVAPLAAGVVALSARGRGLREVLSEILRDGQEILGSALSRLAEPDPEPEPDPKDVPRLQPDGVTVRFVSHAQFVVQHRTNITHGALVIAAEKLAAGTQRTLRLEIVGLDDVVTISGRVAFQGDSTLGLMIDNFSTQKAVLEGLLDKRPTKKLKVASLPPKRPVAYTGRITASPGLERLLEFGKARPASPEAAGGWLPALLDHLFAARFRGVAVLRKGPQSLSLWIHDGCIVFTRSEPSAAEQTLGRRLLAEGKVSVEVLESALVRARETHELLGNVLVEMGAIAPGAVHMSLRGQTLERLRTADEWVDGEIELLPWVDPGIQIGLVMTSGKTILAGLLRGELARESPEALERFVEPQLDRTLRFLPANLDPAFDVRGRDRRILERLAEQSSIRELLDGVGAERLAVLRLVVLGRALGFLDFGRPAREKTAAERNAEVELAIEERLCLIEGTSAFDALGLHWACQADQLDQALATRLSELSAVLGSREEVRLAELASRAEASLRRAHQRLSNVDERRAERLRTAGAPERARTADALLDQVELLIIQDDLPRAQAVLRCAEEIHPSPRCTALVDALRA